MHHITVEEEEHLKTLAELKAANLPKITLDDLGISNFAVFGKPEAVDVAKVNEYLQRFVKVADGKCPRCEEPAHVQWGFVHGEAYCTTSGCGYPARVYHYDLPGCEKQVACTLMYHPDVLKESEPAADPDSEGEAETA